MTWRLASRLLLLGIIISTAVSMVLASLSGYLDTILPLLIIWLVGVFSGTRSSHLFSLKTAHGSSLALSLGLGMFNSGFFILLGTSIDYLTKGRWSQFIERTPAVALPDSILLAVLVALLLCISEELLFRGFLVRAFSELGAKTSLVFPLFFFVIFHPPVNMPAAFILGLLAESMLLATDSVLPAIVMHCANNLVCLLVDRVFPQHVIAFALMVFVLGTWLVWYLRSRMKEVFSNVAAQWEASPAMAKGVLSEWSCIVLIVLGILSTVAWFAVVRAGA